MSTSVNPNPNSLIKDAVIIRDFNRDFNNDGQADIFWRNSQTGENGIWLMSGTKPNYYTSAEFVQPPVPIAWDYTTGDFDNDGNSDLFWHNSDTGENAIWLMNGTTYRNDGAVPLQQTLSGETWDYSTGDFDGDGNSDIFLRNFETGENRIWLTVNGTNVVDLPSVPSLAKEWDYSIADFNGDRTADIFWRNQSTGENTVWLNNGANFNPSPLSSVPVTGWDYQIADFNGDSRTDIFWRNENTEQSAVWLINEAGTNYTENGAVFLPTNVPAAWDANIGDFDRDGRTDILWRNSQTGQNAIWLMNDTGTNYKAAEFLPNVPLAWNAAGITDFNGDGKSDIFWRNSQTGEDAVWLIDGTTYTAADFLATVPTSWSPV
ncbi:MAG: VCBS repeat-containing protein [Scytonema hyalinum WJT4-NPBG1]|jgi:hypothetical protein|nr:VCBS repeat-containing protein [Scytonema hyalinum WJT4-NPBG1]